jgi:transposase
MNGNDPLGREGGDGPCADGEAASVEGEPPTARSDDSRVENASGAFPTVREAVEQDYVYGDLSIDRIAAKHGTSDKTVTRWAKEGGWVRLVGTRPLKPGRKPRPPGAPPAKRATIAEMHRRNLVRRLYQVLDVKLKEIETRMQQVEGESAAPQSSADAERDVRSLTALARIYSKLVELDEAANRKGSGKAEAARSDDADQLRRDLALRLERLNRERDA